MVTSIRVRVFHSFSRGRDGDQAQKIRFAEHSLVSDLASEMFLQGWILVEFSFISRKFSGEDECTLICHSFQRRFQRG